MREVSVHHHEADLLAATWKLEPGTAGIREFPPGSIDRGWSGRNGPVSWARNTL